MTNPAVKELEQPDTATTVRPPVRSTVLAQLEAALLAETLTLSDPRSRDKGVDPYNQTMPLRDAWGSRR